MRRYPISSKDKLVVIANVLKPLLQDSRRFYGNSKCTAALYIKAGRLCEIQQIIDPWTYTAPEGWEVIRIPAQWLLVPAFVDCHVHLALDGISGFKGLHGPVDDGAIAERLRQAADGGITALRDGGDRYETSFKARLISEINDYPRVICTGRAIFRKGLYGTNLGGEGIESMDDVEKRLLQLKEKGAEQIKVVLSGLISFSNPGKVGPLHFSVDEMKTITVRAKEYGLPVMVHVNSDQAVRIAVEAGVSTVEHGFFLSAETLQLMADNNVGWIPTAAPAAAAISQTKSRKEAVSIKKILEQHLNMIKLGHEMGVIIGIGTDTGSPGVDWNNGYRQEMKLFARAGLSSLDILMMASINGAGFLGLKKERGLISIGQKAHWLCLEQDILSNMENFNGPAGIILPH
ncbi:MAG: amidohydrolase family protein [Bacillota bacterium]|nr:amidohydrolase family protein [Bacillota bacterium]